MPTRKLPEEEIKLWGNLHKICTDPEHNPPSMMAYEPGTYEHSCPNCGHKIVFTVNGFYL